MSVREAGTADVEAFYFGAESRRLFAALSRPRDAAGAGLAFCPPFADEMVVTYARLALWGKELSRQGIAMLRHHPFGTGESDGRFAEFTLQGAVDDAVTAARWLRANVRADRLGLFGLRLGAAVAARAAPAAQPNFLVLWAPVLDLRRYFRELLRWRLAKELVHQRIERVKLTVGDMIARLEAGETVDLAGYELSPELHRQMTAGRGWPERAPAPRVLWVTRPPDESKAAAVVGPWREDGARVDVVVVDEPIFWESIAPELPRGFVDATLGWIADVAGPRAEGR